jgi:hypothetical protein
MRRQINFLMDKHYRVYICSGEGENYRESGGYSAYGANCVDAAEQFASHHTKCSYYPTYGTNWQKICKQRELPNRFQMHHYLMDEKGNKILLIFTDHY